MKYDFRKFSTDIFERLVQSIFQQILGNNSIIFGDGADGGRELTYSGSAPFPNETDNWKGYWVIQAKFRKSPFADRDEGFKWVVSQFKSEMRKFQDPKRNLKIPDNYLFISNVILTPVHAVGGRDKIEALKHEYKKLIPNIFIGGYDELCGFLDNNRDVRLTYSEFLLTSDIIASLLEQTKPEDFDEFKKYQDEISKLNVTLDRLTLENAELKYEYSQELNNINVEKERLISEREIFRDQINEIFRSLEDSKDKFDTSIYRKVILQLTVNKNIEEALATLNEYTLQAKEKELSKARILKGKLLFAKLEFDEAETNFLKAKNISDNFESNLELGKFYYSMEKFSEALSYYQTAIDQVENEKNKLVLMGTKALVYKDAKDYDNSKQLFLKVIERAKENFKTDKGYLSTILSSLFNYANLINDSNDSNDSEDVSGIYKSFIDIYELLGDKIEYFISQEFLGQMLGNTGIYFYEKNDFAQAERYLKKGLDILNSIESTIGIIESICTFELCLGNTYAENEKFDQAFELIESSTLKWGALANAFPDFYISKYAENHIELCLFIYYVHAKPLPVLLEIITRLRQIDNKYYNFYDLQLANCLLYLCLGYQDIDETEKAIEIKKEALNILDSSASEKNSIEKVKDLFKKMM